ncbi:hypothetical protein H8E88_03625 [candidate division KSB1 bacterium]|nr:hypothetical protein [candidate division KSB1 bacterium]MBL7094586.1 hypothetical protein [candidate division KSB1 bacterium]
MSIKADHSSIIQDVYEAALKILQNDELEKYIKKLNKNEKEYLDTVCKNAETKKGVLVKDAYEKFKAYPINRYYILTTADKVNKEDEKNILAEVNKISTIHGCQVIVNGIYPSLRYYLRLLNNTYTFIDQYVDNIKLDRALKFSHKEKWNEIIAIES